MKGLYHDAECYFDGDKKILCAFSWTMLTERKEEFVRLIGKNIWNVEKLYRYTVPTRVRIKNPEKYMKKKVKDLDLSAALEKGDRK